MAFKMKGFNPITKMDVIHYPTDKPARKVTYEEGVELANKQESVRFTGAHLRRALNDPNLIEFSRMGRDEKTRILSKVKDLYPVSNADIEILLKGQGSLATNTGALKVLISSEKALADIETLAFDKAQSLAFPGGDLKGDVNFKKNAADAAAKELAAQYNDQVSDELLKELYGNTDRTDFRIVQAFNYKNLKADKAYEGNSFEKFLEGKANTIQETDNIINKYQKKKEN